MLKYIKSEIERIQTISEPTLIAYKGFPIEFVNNINFELGLNPVYRQLLNDQSRLLIEDESIDIKKYVKDCLTSDSDLILMPYLLLKLLDAQIDIGLLSRKILIVENQLYKKYPNEFAQRLKDTEEVIDNIDKVYYAESRYLNQICASVENQFGIEFITYLDLNYNDDLTTIELTKSAELIHVIKDEVDGIQYGSEDYLKLLKELYFGQIKVGDSIALSLTVDSLTKEISSELALLQKLITDCDANLEIQLLKKAHAKTNRPELHEILKKYWSSEQFRTIEFYSNPDENNDVERISQGTIVEKITSESEAAFKGSDFHDVFVTAPTGSGKSLLYQIPAKYLSDTHGLVTIVVSPLIALMEDQINDLQSKGIYEATFINSNISFIEREKKIEALKNGYISILYLSPELLLSYDITHFIGERSIGLFVVDEAHLVTTWGRDFRVDYWFIGNYIQKLRNRQKMKFPIAAFTATAAYGGPNDLVFETIESLKMVIRDLFIGKARRDDIIFDVNQVSYTKYQSEREKRTVDIIKEYIDNNKKALIYFPWVQQIKKTYSSLDNDIRDQVETYNGGMYKQDKSDVLEGFKKGKLKVVLASKAFGMGVDISDIEEVYHHAPSGSLSDYIQEIGRVARRSDIKGKAKVDFSVEDLRYAKVLYGLSAIKQWEVNAALKKIYQIYLQRDKRNFLLSIEDFSHIFDITRDECENKVKSALVLLEQDLQKKYNYPAIIVRPKSLFAEVYCWVRESRCGEFERKYNRFIDRKITNDLDYVDPVTGRTKTDNRTIFKIRLNQYWESMENGESFPRIKADFFSGELFKEFRNDYNPVYELNVKLKKPANDTVNVFRNSLLNLEAAFRKVSSGFFTRDDFMEALEEAVPSKRLRNELVDVTLSIFESPTYKSNITEGNITYNKLSFLQKKRDGDQHVYRILSSNYSTLSKIMVNEFYSIFYDLKSHLVSHYIPFDLSKSRLQHQTAQLIEAFNLGTFELIGGSRPLLFIRVNDPNKIGYLVSHNYQNNIVADIKKRHSNSMEIMELFFMSDFDTKKRWDFIESYFLGKDLLEPKSF